MTRTTYTLEIMRFSDKELHETLTFDTLEEAEKEVGELVKHIDIYRINIHKSVVEAKLIREIVITTNL